jgi:serine/threonine-protein kinase RsbW
MTRQLQHCRRDNAILSCIRLTIDSALSELFVISVLIRGVCDHLGTDEARTYSLELCAVEAVTNAIKHAYRGVPGNEVTLEISFTRERVDLRVLDRGLSMSKEQVLKLSASSQIFEFDPDCLDSIPVGGMGLEIIRQQMDEIGYSTDSGRNCFTLTKFLLPDGSGWANG